MSGEDKIRRAGILAAGALAIVATMGFGRMLGDAPFVIIGVLVLFLSGPVLATAWPRTIFGAEPNTLFAMAPLVVGACASLIVPADRISAVVAGAAGGIVVSWLGRDLRLLGRLSQSAALVLVVAGSRFVFVRWHGLQGMGLFLSLVGSSVGAAAVTSVLFRALRPGGFVGTCILLGTMLSGGAIRMIHDGTQNQIRWMVATILVEFLLMTMVGARETAAGLRALPRTSALSEPLCAVPLLDRKKDVALEAYVE